MRLKPHRTFLLALARALRLLLGLRRGKRYTSPPASNKPILRGANAVKAIVEPSRPSSVRQTPPEGDIVRRTELLPRRTHASVCGAKAEASSVQPGQGRGKVHV